MKTHIQSMPSIGLLVLPKGREDAGGSVEGFFCAMTDIKLIPLTCGKFAYKEAAKELHGDFANYGGKL